jgi:hypothetical protein
MPGIVHWLDLGHIGRPRGEKHWVLYLHAHGAGLEGSLIGLVTVEDINCAGFGEDLFGHGSRDEEMGSSFPDLRRPAGRILSPGTNIICNN